MHPQPKRLNYRLPDVTANGRHLVELAQRCLSANDKDQAAYDHMMQFEMEKCRQETVVTRLMASFVPSRKALARAAKRITAVDQGELAAIAAYVEETDEVLVHDSDPVSFGRYWRCPTERLFRAMTFKSAKCGRGMLRRPRSEAPWRGPMAFACPRSWFR